ncbi:MAG: HD-GYP domain-containing protein [Lachnospiraceae bacterium]|nr:HD-GYP domain-containing protein [Lachnospiraceae bacterium]
MLILQVYFDVTTTSSNAKEQAIDFTSDAMFILTPHKQFRFANASAKRMLPELDWENDDDITDFINECLINRDYYESADRKHYEIKLDPLNEDGFTTGYILWLRDISAQLSTAREEEKVRKAKEILVQTATALVKAIDAKDKYTNGHSLRVAEYSKMIALILGKDEKYIEDLYNMALLHDVGKIGIPDRIINKPDKLTDEEFEIVKRHPAVGGEILSEITEFPELMIGARWHHEKYDGTGYPDGLKGDAIPEYARIICVADAYDTMSSRRSYRDILPQSIIREEIEKNSGTQFDPVIAKAMLFLIDSDTKYTMHE